MDSRTHQQRPPVGNFYQAWDTRKTFGVCSPNPAYQMLVEDLGIFSSFHSLLGLLEGSEKGELENKA